MTQQLCNEYQYEDREESSPPPTNHSSNPPAQNFSQYEQPPHDEATQMLAQILSMSNANETSSSTTHVPATTDDNSDSDVSYWSEDERTILRAFYENERDDGNEQNDEDNDEALLERYIMDLCQTTGSTAKPLLPPLSLTQAPPPSSSPQSSYASASSSSHS
ncbi:hypothetical protein MUCCIDRAFT_114757 [Mucor lusitanicus CBS 277.49]|uniref:Uncharacterized protein n=1 Tax=Mucor lusitanicus CBS 277.49 TaxID=747725 RepID=A0A168I558_MUCCL|nr:hypothetical protein MUCCIDRAFT_114757 [Mucor lusitanicus CBS 277.49]